MRTRPWSALIGLLLIGLLFNGVALLALLPNGVGAQPGLSAEQRATLEAVAQLLGEPAELAVVQTADDALFVDAAGAPRPLLISGRAADGALLIRCVSSVAEAAAFFASLDGAPALAAFDPLPADAPAITLSQTTVEIIVVDAAGEGFNDPTPVAPIGGNSGATLGEQRLKALQYAAAVWASSLETTVPIQIEAAFDPLPGCSPNSGVLGFAGAANLGANFTGSGFFPGAEQPDTWYPIALANKRAGRDLDQTNPDISAVFNSAVGQPGCLTEGWYYGFDAQEGAQLDLVAVMLHELGHGLGFISFVGLGDQEPLGALLGGRNDIWNSFLIGDVGGTELLWKDMSEAQRAASISSGALAWDGPAVTAGAAQLYATGAPRLSISSPGGLGPFDGSAASFGPLVSTTPLAAELVAGLDLDEDGAATAYSDADACTPLLNGASLLGKIALVSRGPCAPNVQARNLQAAGALAAIIADNVGAAAPPALAGADAGVSIPVAGLTLAQGEALRSALGAGAVTVQLALARPALPPLGTDPRGRLLMYAPDPVEPGSSVSHFDISAGGPNLLMEPLINPDVGPGLDLSDDLLRDIGWYPDLSFNGLDDRREINLGLAMAGPTTGRPGQSVTLTLTVENRGFTTASATLSQSFDARLGAPAWSASYAGGAGGPPAGSGNLAAALILPPGGRASFVVRLTLPNEPGGAIQNQATLGGIAQGDLVDVSGTGDDSAALSISLLANGGSLVYIPMIIR